MKQLRANGYTDNASPKFVQFPPALESFLLKISDELRDDKDNCNIDFNALPRDLTYLSIEGCIFKQKTDDIFKALPQMLEILILNENKYVNGIRKVEVGDFAPGYLPSIF